MLNFADHLVRYTGEYQPLVGDLAAWNLVDIGSERGGVLIDPFERPFHNEGELLGVGGLANTSPFLLVADLPNLTVNEDQVLSIDMGQFFQDADPGDSLTFAANLENTQTLPNWLSFDSNTGEFSGTPANDDVGIFTITLTATDSFGAEVTSDFVLEVVNTNDAPTVVPGGITDVTINEDQSSSWQVSSFFEDVDLGDQLSYNATLLGGAALPGWLSFDTSVGEFSGMPLNDDVGTLTIAVTASDLSGELVTGNFVLEIVNTNDAPVLVGGGPTDVSINEDQGTTWQISSAFNDVDLGDQLSYSATLLGGSALPGWLSFDTSVGEFSGLASNADVGTYSISVTATDLSGESVNGTFTLEVTNTNDAPTVVPGGISDVTINEDQASSWQVSSFFEDVDLGDQLSYSATLLGGAALPGWMSFDANTGEFSGTPLNDDVGSLTISVTATDLSGGSVTSSFDLEVVNINDAPTATSFSLQGTEDTSVTLNFSDFLNHIDDVDDSGQDLQINIQSVSSGTLNGSFQDLFASSSSVTFMPVSNDASSVTIAYTVEDPQGGESQSATLTIGLTPQADTPTLQASSVQLDTSTQTLSFVVAAALVDLDGSETLSVAVSQDVTGATLTGDQFTIGSQQTSITQTVSIDYSAMTSVTTFTVTATSTEGQNNDQSSESFNLISGTESPIDLDEMMFDFSTGPATTGLLDPENLTFSTIDRMPTEVGTLYAAGSFDGVAGDETLFTFSNDSGRLGFLDPDDLTFTTLGDLPPEVGTLELAGNFDGLAGDELLFRFSNDSNRLGFLDTQDMTFSTLGDLPTEVGSIEAVGNFDGVDGDEIVFSFSNAPGRLGLLDTSDMSFTTIGDLPTEVGSILAAGNFDQQAGEELLFTFSNAADRIGLLSLDDLSFTTIGDLPREVDEILSVGNFDVSQAGDDVLLGGTGNDFMVGLSGDDTFVFDLSAATGNDAILDFMTADDTVKFENVLDSSGFSVTDDGADVTISWDDTTGAGSAGSVVLTDIGGANFANMQDLVDAGIQVVVEA